MFVTSIFPYIPIAHVVSRFELVFEAGNLRRIDHPLHITAQSDPAPAILAGRPL